MKIYNLYLFSKGSNVGDLYASPLNYFDFPFDIERMNIVGSELRKSELEDSVVILGGGGLFHLPSIDYADGRMEGLEYLKSTVQHIIGWGIGSNIHDEKTIVYPGKCTEGFLALGVRDQGQNFEWVPCPSCMDKRFRFKYEIKEDIVAFEHPGVPIPLEYQKMGAAGSEFEDVIRFIGQCRTLVTSSYHGAYWGMLLGKKVVIYKPFSSRFYAIHPKVLHTDGSDLDFKIKQAKSDVNFLKQCRAANRKFHKKVIDLLEGLQ